MSARASSCVTPRVSIGLVVYNGERFLTAAIQSILDQSFSDFELIISDNASTDRTEEVCREFASTDRRVKYLRQPVNIGPAANFAYVLEHAIGELFMWAAHDDTREPDCLEHLVAALDSNPQAVLASCGFDNLDWDGRVVCTDRTDWRSIFSGPKHLQFARLIQLDEVASQKANHIYGLVRRAQLQEALRAMSFVGTYSGNDNCTLLYLLGVGDFTIVPRVLFHYRVAPPVPSRRQVQVAGALATARYVWQRIVGRSRGHYGNLLDYLRRTNEYFEGLRVVVQRAPVLNWFDRLYLQLLIMIRQLVRPIRTVLASARHEL